MLAEPRSTQLFKLAQAVQQDSYHVLELVDTEVPVRVLKLFKPVSLIPHRPGCAAADAAGHPEFNMGVPALPPGARAL